MVSRRIVPRKVQARKRCREVDPEWSWEWSVSEKSRHALEEGRRTRRRGGSLVMPTKSTKDEVEVEGDDGGTGMLIGLRCCETAVQHGRRRR